MRNKFIVVDVILVVASYLLGMWVRLIDPLVSQESAYLLSLLKVMPVIIALHLGCNFAFGVYRHPLADGLVGARRAGLATALAMPLLVGVVLLARGLDVVVPFSVVILGGLGVLAGMVLVRSFWRSKTGHG